MNCENCLNTGQVLVAFKGIDNSLITVTCPVCKGKSINYKYNEDLIVFDDLEDDNDINTNFMEDY